MGTREKLERIAPVYDLIDLAEHTFKRPLRRRLFAGLGGTILDAGVGTGRNMAHYPAGARMYAIDVSPRMLARARRRRARLGRAVELREADIRATGLPDDHFDAVVAAFVFAVLEDPMQAPALAELARICKRTGEVRILDYVSPRHPCWRLYVAAWLPWERVVFNCAFDRETARYLPQAGLEPVSSELVYKDMVRLTVARPAAASRTEDRITRRERPTTRSTRPGGGGR